MPNIFLITLKGLFRDRVFRGILMTAVVFLLIPLISRLSMRQVTELSVTLSLSLISFILLLLSVFLGGTTIWKDIEKKYAFSALGLPMSRTTYVAGKFFGISGFIVLTAMFLSLIAIPVIWYSSLYYPPVRPIAWANIALSVFFDMMKYIFLVSFAFLFSSISTSFFLPIFGTISIFLIGSYTQEVYDFIHSTAGETLPLLVKNTTTMLYYILPNFGAFDLKVNAVYGIALSLKGLVLTFGYFIAYASIVVAAAALNFSRREIE